MAKEFTAVNHSIPKIDAIGLVTGKPAYTDDLAPRDALVVKLLRSPHAFAKIAAIDTGKALAVPGVACILTWKDVERIPYTRAGQGHPEPSPHDKFILDEYLRYVGDEVAIVAAEDEASAIKALSLIDVKYEILEPVLDFESAADNSVIIHPEPEIHEMFPIGFEPARNIAASYDMRIGDVEKELAKSDVVLQKAFYTQIPGPCRHGTARRPSAISTSMAGSMSFRARKNPSIPAASSGRRSPCRLRGFRVMKPRVGGAFGGKQHIHVEPFVALVHP